MQTRGVDDIRREMDTLTAFINDCVQSVEDGRIVDLKGLDDQVAALCDSALGLPPQDAAQIQSPMAAMISKVEALEQALRAFRDRAGRR